jgi:hypothetical protein
MSRSACSRPGPRIECGRCGKVQMVNEAHARWQDRTLRNVIARIAFLAID